MNLLKNLYLQKNHVELPRNINRYSKMLLHWVFLITMCTWALPEEKKRSGTGKITRMKELNPTQYINTNCWMRIAKQFDGADGEMKTPLQSLGTEYVWSQACHFELFMFVLGLGHWMVCPMQKSAKTQCYPKCAGIIGKGKAKRHPDFNASELKALKAWARDKPHYEKILAPRHSGLLNG